MRFWRCPDGWLLPGGRRVDWLAAGTFDTSVGLSLFTLQVTHKIDADTDVERDHIVATVTAADPRRRVDVIEDFSTGYHARNGGGDSISTDGDLPIVDVRAVEAVRRDDTPAPQKRPAFEPAARLLRPTGLRPRHAAAGSRRSPASCSCCCGCSPASSCSSASRPGGTP